MPRRDWGLLVLISCSDKLVGSSCGFSQLNDRTCLILGDRLVLEFARLVRDLDRRVLLADLRGDLVSSNSLSYLLLLLLLLLLDPRRGVLEVDRPLRREFLSSLTSSLSSDFGAPSEQSRLGGATAVSPELLKTEGKLE